MAISDGQPRLEVSQTSNDLLVNRRNKTTLARSRLARNYRTSGPVIQRMAVWTRSSGLAPESSRLWLANWYEQDQLLFSIMP
jgi:hypothetical protein